MVLPKAYRLFIGSDARPVEMRLPLDEDEFKITFRDEDEDEDDEEVDDKDAFNICSPSAPSREICRRISPPGGNKCGLSAPSICVTGPTGGTPASDFEACTRASFRASSRVARRGAGGEGEADRSKPSAAAWWRSLHPLSRSPGRPR